MARTLHEAGECRSAKRRGGAAEVDRGEKRRAAVDEDDEVDEEHERMARWAVGRLQPTAREWGEREGYGREAEFRACSASSLSAPTAAAAAAATTAGC